MREFRFVNSGLLYGLPPRRSTKKSAGYDLHSIEDAVIEPGQRKLVKTGVTIFLNDDEEAQVRPRSGLALKHGITVLNSPGTIDADYAPNEIGVILYNTSNVPFQVSQGDRIAQLVISKYLTADDDWPLDQERQSGFGSTGV